MALKLKNIRQAVQFSADDLALVGKLMAGRRLTPYIGMVGHNNLGDEILYQAHQALFPEHELTPYRIDTMYVEKFSNAIGKPFCSHAILGGGTLINDGDVWIGKVEQLQAQGKKVFSIGTGAESSAFYGDKDETNQLLKRWVKTLSSFEFVGVRGPQSKEILDKAGASDVVITGDTALALTPDVLARPRVRGVVGITYGDVKGNPMWGDPKKYRQEVVKVIQNLIQGDYKVVLLPIWDIDLPSNRSIMHEINHPNLTMVEAFSSLQKFASAVRSCEYFIGQKLHSTIIAIMHRVPSVMVEYRPKCRDFMKSVGLEDYVIKTSDFTAESFAERFGQLAGRADDYVALAETKMLEYKQKQFAQAEALKQVLSH